MRYFDHSKQDNKQFCFNFSSFTRRKKQEINEILLKDKLKIIFCNKNQILMDNFLFSFFLLMKNMVGGKENEMNINFLLDYFVKLLLLILWIGCASLYYQ